jgi:branched-chain amino acid transport system substrate-binding protein
MKKVTICALLASVAMFAHSQSAPPPIKLGMIADFSSVFADSVGKGSAAAIGMAIDDFGGSVLGRKVVLLTADHQNKPEIGANVARQWIDVEKIDAFVETQNSSVALAINDLARKANLVNIMTSPGSSDFTGKLCAPHSIHWTWDTYMAVNAVVRPLVEKGFKSFYYIIPEGAFGRATLEDAKRILAAQGATLVGFSATATGSTDFSSPLLQAQASKAQVIVIGGGGQDASNSLKQAAEFGISPAQQLAGVVVNTTEINATGLNASKGLMVAETFYWDLNDQTRAWAKRYEAKTGRMPNQMNAGVYGATTHLLKSMQAAGTVKTEDVMKKMRELPITDLAAKTAKLRADGRVERDVFLFQVKSPAESKSAADVYKLVATIPGDKAFRPMSEGGCPLITK